MQISYTQPTHNPAAKRNNLFLLCYFHMGLRRTEVYASLCSYAAFALSTQEDILQI